MDILRMYTQYGPPLSSVSPSHPSSATAHFRHGPRATRVFFRATIEGMRALLLAVVIVALWMGGSAGPRSSRSSRKPTSASRTGVTGATTGSRAATGTTAPASYRGRRRQGLACRAAVPARPGPGGCCDLLRGGLDLPRRDVCRAAPGSGAVRGRLRRRRPPHPLAELDARARARRRRACRGDGGRTRGAHAAVAHLGRHAPRPCLASRDVAEQRAAPEAAGRRRGVRLERAVRALRELTARRAAAPARCRLHGAARLARCRCRRSPGRVRSPTRSRFSSS